jgi:hypothetical protein
MFGEWPRNHSKTKQKNNWLHNPLDSQIYCITAPNFIFLPLEKKGWLLS